MQHPKQRTRQVEKLKGVRQDLSKQEKLIWNRVKPSVSFQFNIKRKHLLLDKYTVDFFCSDLLVAFEIEGGPSDSLSEEAAAIRYRELEELGVSFVRLPLEWVLKKPNEASEFVLDICRGFRTVDELDESFLSEE